MVISSETHSIKTHNTRNLFILCNGIHLTSNVLCFFLLVFVMLCFVHLLALFFFKWIIFLICVCRRAFCDVCCSYFPESRWGVFFIDRSDFECPSNSVSCYEGFPGIGDLFVFMYVELKAECWYGNVSMEYFKDLIVWKRKLTIIPVRIPSALFTFQ